MREMMTMILGLILLTSLGACSIEPGADRYISDDPYYSCYATYSIGGACDWRSGNPNSCSPHYCRPGYYRYGGAYRPYAPGARGNSSSPRWGGFGGSGGGFSHGSHSSGSHSSGSHGGHR